MTDWPVKTLGDVCEVIAGQSPEGKFYNKEGKGVPFYQGKKDFAERILGSPTTWTSEVTKLARPGDILMSVRAPVGPVNLCPIDACIGRGLAAIRPSSKTDTDFIYYYLESIQSEIAGTEGAVFASINKAQIEGLRCPVPPLDEQKRIVKLLDAATARVTELTACYEQARTHANNLFASALRDALESNPDWPVKTLGDISEIAYGYTESAKSEKVGPKFLRITDIKDRGVNWDEVPFCPIDSEQLKRHRLEDGDIVFARTGATTGKSFLVIDPPLAVCASYLIRLRIDKKMVSPDFLNLNFQTTGYWKQVNEGMSGAAQGGFNATKLGLLEIPVPSLEEQKRIVAQLDSLRSKTSEMVAAYDAKLTAAMNLRQSILESAFAGEL